MTFNNHDTISKPTYEKECLAIVSETFSDYDIDVNSDLGILTYKLKMPEY